LHVGAAIAVKNPKLRCSTWGIGQSADAETRKREASLERAVSKHIGEMRVLWLAIDDESSPASDRAYLERNIIGLLSGRTSAIDPPSKAWLGLSSPNSIIRNSGLWNLDHIDFQYDPGFLSVLKQYIDVTLGSAPSLGRRIAPTGWHPFDQQLDIFKNG
jgi:hypothetical protein